MAYAPPRRASHAPFSVTAGHAARSAGNVVLGRLGQYGELIQNTAFHTRQRKAFRRDFPLRTRTFPWKKSGGKISGTQSEEYIFPKRATVVPPGTAPAPRKRQRRKQLIDKNIKRTEYRTNETTDSLRAKKFSGRVNTPYLCLQRCEALMLRKSRSRSQGTRNEPVLATSHPPRPLSQKQHSAPHARNLGAVARFMLSSAGHRRPERPGHKKAGTFSGPGPYRCP